MLDELKDVFSKPESAARLWAPLRRFSGLEENASSWANARGPAMRAGYEFLRFGIKQAWACFFGASLLALIILTKIWYPHHAPLPRYDTLFIAALCIQIFMLLCRFETLREAKVIFVFHVIGMAMEIFKTSIGAWVYPEPSLFRIGGVPLFTGFMYAAIGSYLTRIWLLLDFRFSKHPPLAALAALAAAIYANFFLHHFLPDVRLWLLAATAILFGRTTIYFRPWHADRRMPLLLGFTLVACFIWFAENIGTFTDIWRYPMQRHGWHMVPAEKLEAWFLLMIVSYALIAINQGVRKVDGLAIWSRPKISLS